ncbi:cyclic pyranopterin phosphate synthase [Microlunatus capsulatus]|uniref:GTP 3',8-cyclase n=2 Tax=Microlunatus capsulatus TaxID=99117 RepID=A0ABS4ZBR6_9ACTN|nr:cyclic pyranopterin phosphate synthase [Microlunatus capsulatus]
MVTTDLAMPSVRPGDEPAPAPGPGAGALRDRYGRVATDLRISLTDRCNLRCTYCMPAEGLDWMPHEEVLDDAEVVRLARIGVERLGITTLRLTGGEPLLRKDLEHLVAELTALRPRPVVALTTNGIGLARRADALAAAGLDRINVSLDTLQADTFTKLTRRRRLDDVLAGVRAARRAGLDPVKINTVLMRGVNDHEAVPLLRWAMEEGVQLRFIEQMPLDAQHAWERETMVTAAEIRARIEPHLPLVEDPADALARGSAPAELFRVAGTEHSVGIIAAVSKPFCGSCDRVRLTADGQIRTCLFSRTESDLRGALRAGADDATIADRWLVAVAGKQAGHGIDDPSFLQPDRPMSAIGG